MCKLCDNLGRKRGGNVKYRNIRLTIETYNLLEKYRLELMQKKQDPRVSLDNSVKSLLDYYFKIGNGHSGREES